MQKNVSFKTKGMQRDLSVSAFNSEYSYENKNMRITVTDDNTLLSLVNEKGTKEVTMKNNLEGVIIGQIVIEDTLILFSSNSSSKEDIIYKINILDSDSAEIIELFKGDLNFNPQYPIETLCVYENAELIKVYWTDGINSPRVINIAASQETRNKWTKDSFNFVRTLKLQETINIERDDMANGTFAPGVIQYAFSYYDKYSQESNIFYTSPLYYISYNNRGGSPEDKVSNSFNITISDLDTSFDYIRIYSIHRTSINATPNVKRVVDIAVSSTNITYNDNGTTGDSIDPTELLYIGGEDVIFGTMTQKDNTLFLGDIEIKRKTLNSTIRDFFKGKEIKFDTETKSLKASKINGYYPYTNQLKLSSQKFKTFKYLDYYRFGVQAQYFNGKWSEPIWINDVQNTTPIQTTFFKDNEIQLPIATFTLEDSSIISTFIENGYVRLRPVVVYPTINDREVICQGILCPTVYNVSDRFGNSPFAQSSWFVRPNAPFDFYKAFHKEQSSTGEWSGDWCPLGKWLGNPSIYSRAGIMSYGPTTVVSESTSYDIDIVNKGTWAEFRHNKPLPGNNVRNGEIQCIWDPPTSPYLDNTYTDSKISNWVSDNAENFFIDQSILTMHSPDIEFDDDVKNIDTTGLKLRIVGVVPLTSFASDIDIETSTPVNNFKESSELPIGFYKEPIGVENDFSYENNASTKDYHFGNSHFGWRGLISGAFWFDDLVYKDNVKNPNKLTTGFVVYPWHRNGSLNNTKYATDGYKSALLSKKRLSNIRYSYKTQYLKKDNIWNAYEDKSDTKTGISGVSIFDSNEVSLVRIPSPSNSDLPDINYYGNIDKLLTASRIGTKKDGYPIMTSGIQSANTHAHEIFKGTYTQVNSSYSDYVTGTDPVRMKYKSTPHAVLALNYTTNNYQRVLPTIEDANNPRTYGTFWKINDANDTHTTIAFWDKNKKTLGVSQDVVSLGLDRNIYNIGGLQYGWLWLGELYNDDVKNRFGGQTEEAFENNTWLPCGEPVSLIDKDDNILKSVTLKWTEGDTYYQRYDHIKTYPFTIEDQNQVTDIVSFMCETRINIDGRYDRNRGQTSNFAITPSNFNLMNNVYSQHNNFFTYNTINPNKLDLQKYHNTITWTKTKTLGELIDTWTNITLASTLDLDGDKGKIRALKRLNDNIIAFQDTGISQILYNENTQISTTEGVPIEIGNSGKVQGKRYISDKIGCYNKWSICETPNGIYFIDDITKGIYLFNGQLTNITDKLGFNSWINVNLKGLNIWNPYDFNNFVSYYDKGNNEVLFIDRHNCLAYSEVLGQFTSFYSYENTPYFSNLEDKGIWIKDNKLWLHNEGDYNMFFGSYQPFYTTVIANPDMQIDKIFNTLEFRADSWNTNGEHLNTTFDTLTTWNEYQEGINDLKNIPNKPSTLKQKFRIWRANIPRDSSNNRDRMRNPWLYLQLAMNDTNTNKTILHDMIVYYFE